MTIPVTAIVVTRNEEKRLPACLDALRRFKEVLVVDSSSRDATVEVARSKGARVVPFVWNGSYPKKRQWILEQVPLEHDWVFFVDADEIVTPALSDEIEVCLRRGPLCQGYFIKGRYVLGGKVLKFGVENAKLALFDRHAFSFPVVDDLDIPGMGEIEGHYQPVVSRPGAKIGGMREYLIHYALDDVRSWAFRHEKYASWEVGMNRKNAWPVDPVPWREAAKRALRRSRFRPELMFLVSYLLKGGCLDGARGYRMAKSRYDYYEMIRRLEEKAS